MAAINWDEIEKRRKRNQARLDALQAKLESNGLNIDNPVYDLGCQDIIDGGGLGNCSRDWDANPNLYIHPNCRCNSYDPSQQPFQKSLSFNDIDQNELLLIGLPIPVDFVPEPDFIIKANQLFVSTFLGDYN